MSQYSEPHPLESESRPRRLLSRLIGRSFRRPIAHTAVVESLEPRLLLSAELGLGLDAPRDPLADELGLDGAAPLVTQPVAHDSEATSASAPDALDLDGLDALTGEEDGDRPAQRHELLMLDGAVEDREQLLARFRAGLDPDTVLDVVVLDPESDGVEALSRALAGYRELDAIHLVAHGSDGGIQLGDTLFDADQLAGRVSDVASWGRALGAEGDLLLYGCDVAGSAVGQAWLRDLAAVTGADVAASTDVTGAAGLGGDWDLEYRHGSVQTVSLAPGETGAGWQHSLALIATESFDYAAGTGGLNGQTGGSGWANAWENVGGDMDVVASSLADASGTLTTSGGAAQLSTDSGSVTQGRDLITSLGADGTTVWASFLVEPDQTAFPNSTGLGLGDTGIFVGYGNGEYKMANRGGGGDVLSGINPVTGQDTLVVLKLEFASGNDTVSMYLNPTPGEITPDTAPVAVKSDRDLGSFTKIDLSGADGSNDAILDEIRIGETFADVVPVHSASSGALWLSTAADVASPSGAPGLDAWNEDEVLKVSGSDFSLGAGAATDGTFSLEFDLGSFGPNQDVNGLHFINSSFTVGSGAPADTFTFQPGDLLLTVNGGFDYTYNGNTTSITVQESDVFVFRPQAEGDYSGGEFYFLLDDPIGDNIRGVAVVESPLGVTVGDGPTLVQGTFLFSERDPGEHDNVYTYLADRVGESNTDAAAGREILIDGEDTGDLTYTDQIQGIHIIESDMNVGGVDFQAGDLLLTLNQDQLNASLEGVGTTNQEVYQQDVFRLRLSETSQGPNGRSVGMAEVVFDGSSVGLGSNEEDLDALTLVVGTPATIADEFNATSYAGNDGTREWNNDWQEVGEVNGPGPGNVAIWNRLGEQGLYLWAADNKGAWRSADLIGASSAALSFDWAMFNTEAGDSVSLQISTDGGGAWATLDTFDGPLDLSALQSASYDLSDYITSDTRIKFETTSGFSANDEFFVDNVRIQLSGLALLNDEPTLTAFTEPVAFTNEDTQVELSLAELLGRGNEADSDGTVDAFVVKSVLSGTLKIGTSEATATAFAAGSNDVIDATLRAYWTPDAAATGTLDALELVARDDDSAESSTAGVIAKVAVNGGAARLVVTTTDDTWDGDVSSIAALLADKGADGQISLREAVHATNNTGNVGGPDEIHFDIAGIGPHIIQPLGVLPDLEQAVIIDGSSEPDHAGAPVVRIDGALAGNVDGFTLAVGSDGSTLRGLSITGYAASGPAGDAITIFSDNNRIAGNYIGLETDGDSVAANQSGIDILQDASGNVIGGTSASDRNVLTGNVYAGVAIHGSNTDDNRVLGNYIGLNAAGDTVLGGSARGVSIWDQSSGNEIGGTAAGEANRIAGNGVGVLVDGDADNTSIRGNEIYQSTDLGIDLNIDGVSANDGGDVDGGANSTQNFPVLSTAVLSGGNLTIQGGLNSAAGATFTLDFYASSIADPLGHGEAEKYLGSVAVTTDGGGNVFFSETLGVSGVSAGYVVTATATTASGETSEFARNVSVEYIGTVTEATGLWLSTTSDVTAGGMPGLDTWDDAVIVELGGGTLSLEPGGTNGLFSLAFDPEPFAAGVDINGTHLVSSAIQVGTPAFQLEPGDVLFTTVFGVTFVSPSTPTDAGFTNNLTVTNGDVAVFRPDNAGDYTSGTFALLLENVTGDGSDVRGITLIEHDVNVGDAALSAGDFLFTRSGFTESNDVWLYETGSVGAGSTGATSVLLSGGDVGIGQGLGSVEVVEKTTTVGGRTLAAGTLLLSVETGENVGDNSLAVTTHDVFALQLEKTTLIAGVGKGDASLLFDGSDVSFDVPAEDLRSLALVTDFESASIISQTVPGPQSLDEDATVVFSMVGGNEIVVSDSTTVDVTLQVSLAVNNGSLALAGTSGITFAGGANGTASMVLVGTESDINAALNGLVFTPDPDFHGSVSLKVDSELASLVTDLDRYHHFDVAGALGNDNGPAGGPPATVNGVVGINDGTRGNVAEFYGAEYMEIPGSFGDPASVTLAAWVNLDAGAGSGEVISLGDNVALRLDDPNMGYGVTGFFYDGTTWQHTFSGIDIAGTGWHHVAYAFDDALGEQRLYMDGVEVASTTHAGGITYANVPNTHIGRLSTFPSYFFDGRMDEVRIYSRALAAQDIVTLAGDRIDAASTIDVTVNPVGDTPTVTGITTDEDIQSGLIFLDRNAADGAEVTHFRISGISNGTLFLADGTTAVNDGDYITVADGQVGLRFTPALNSSSDGSFDVEASQDGATVAAQSGKATSTITVTALNDAPVLSVPTTAFINELHYDNIGLDTGEAVEIAAMAGTDLTGWSLVFYNGFTGSVYHTEALAGVVADQDSGFGTLVFNLPADGIQNGDSAPDGIALVDDGGQVLQFLSYEGSFLAADGPAAGMNSTDIKVVETGATPVGHSLQLTGSGKDFTWAKPAASTFGAPNTGQNFANVAGALAESVAEDGLLTFSNVGSNAITVFDVDAADSAAMDPVSVTLQVSNGTLTLGGTTGLATLGGDGTASVSFKGTVAEINAALDGLTYQPDPDYSGRDLLTVVVDDLGNTGSGGALMDKAQIVIDVMPVGDTPTAASITTDEDTQSGLIVLDRNAADGPEVTHFRISGITNGTLFLADGTTPVSNNDYITVAQGQAGLRFTPTPNSSVAGSFDVQSSEDGSTVAAQSGVASSTITVTPVGDTPTAASITTDEDTQSGLIVLDRNAGDGVEVTHFRISGITNGTLFLADGTTLVSNGDYILVADGQAGLRFTPTPNSTAAGSFDVQSSEDGSTVAAQSGVASSTITVTPVGDTPTAASITTTEDTQSGLIVLDCNAADGTEVTHFRISGITNGTLFLADGTTLVNNNDYITVAQGQAGLRFTPSPDSTAAGSFDVESSEDGTTVAAQSGVASSTITVTPVGDTPTVADITTNEDTQSGLIVLDRNAADGTEVTHFRISGITGGTLFLADGTTPVSNNDYITVAQGQAGLRFTPTPNSTAAGSFDVESSEDGSTVAAQSGVASSTITVTPVGDTPQAASITTTEDSQSGLIVLDRNAADGTEVTHFRISGITNGTLFLADGTTPVSNGDYILVADGQAGLRFTPTPNSTAAGSFDVQSSEDGSTVAAQSGVASSTITVTPVGDTPQAASITTDEDTQSGLIVLDRNAADGTEVTHFRISGITNGTLFLADGTTPVSNGDYILVADGQAGLRFTPTPNSTAAGSFDVESSEDGSTVAAQSGVASSTITVTPVGDTPTAASIATDEDTQSGLIVLDRNAGDGVEVTHFRISGITNGTLFLADGTTLVSNGDYITVAQGQAGLRFTPSPDSTAAGSFDVQSSEDGSTVAAQSGVASSTITVTPVGDTPQAASITTDEDTQSGLIVLDRNAGDGPEVTHFRISGITNGTLFLADGTTPVSNNDYILVADGQAGLRFTPTPNSSVAGSFDVQSSEDGSTVAAQSGVASSTITVTPVGDTPTAASITTDEDTQSGLIVLDRNAADGTEVTHFRISGITNGTLFLADGTTPVSNNDYITVAQGQAGLRFTPSPDSTAAGSFDVESSEDGTSVAAQSGVASSTITVTPVGDTPQAASITTDEDTQSGLIVLDRNAGDGPEVTHFRISGISNGTLFLADGTTPVSNGDYILVADGQAGLRFTPTPNSSVAGSFDVQSSEDGSTVAAQSGVASSTITVTPVGDTPTVADITTNEDTQSGLIVLDRNAADGTEVTHFRISGITNGTLFLADGTTPVSNGDYILVADGQAGLRFTPIPSSSANGSFDVQASEDGTTVAAQSAIATSTITVTPVGDTPQAASITTNEDTQSGPIVLDRNAADGTEVTHFRISGITNGTLFLADGTTPVSNGDYILVADGQAGLHFTPTPNSTAAGSFDVQSSEDGSTVAAQSGVVTSTITVTPVGDTPTVADITTNEDTQSGLIVLDRNAADGPEVTHFRISGITNGTLFLADGTTPVSNGAYILVADGQAGLRFTPSPNSTGAGSFDVQSSEDGTSVAAQSGVASSTITVTPVGDTPQAASITTTEDSQSGLIVLDRNAADGTEVTHFRISGITNGTLFLADGTTPVSNNDYITVAQGQAGLRFTPSPDSTAAGSFDVESSEDGTSVAAQSGVASSTITVTPVGDTPQAASITTTEDTQSGLIVLDRNAADGTEVTHFRISGITNGTLFLADGTTPVSNGDYILVADGQAGLRFTPIPSSSANGSFDVQASEDGTTVAAQSAIATSTITVTPVGDTPQAASITTNEDTQSGPIVLDRNAGDGVEVTHFRISGITNGTLFLADGTTPVSNGDYILVADGQAGLRFTPSPDSTAAGSFDVQSSEDGSTVAAQSGVASSTITVTPVGDTPQAASITTTEDTQSGLIVLDRNAADGTEVTHFRISGITNGTLFLADGTTPVSNGDYILVADGQAGLRFTPIPSSSANGSFDVQASEDGTTVAAQSAIATSTITVTPVGDTPQAASITTDEDTQSGLLVLDRNTADGPEVTHFRISGITNGTLFLADGTTPVNDGDYILVADGQAGLRFTPSPDSTVAGSFDVQSSEDGSTVAAQSGVATSTITILPQNDPPVLDVNAGTTLNSGGIVTLNSALLSASDVDGPAGSIVFDVVTPALFGQLEFAGAPGVAIGSFTQSDLDSGTLRFVHGGSVVPGDSFAFTVRDAVSAPVGPFVFNVSVIPVDVLPPLLTANTGITVDEGALGSISAVQLAYVDGQQPAGAVSFTITTPVVNGRLELSSAPGVAISGFTQSEVDSGLLRYVHDDSETTADAFRFTVNDGQGNTVGTDEFLITVTPVDDTTVTTTPPVGPGAPPPVGIVPEMADPGGPGVTIGSGPHDAGVDPEVASTTAPQVGDDPYLDDLEFPIQDDSQLPRTAVDDVEEDAGLAEAAAQALVSPDGEQNRGAGPRSAAERMLATLIANLVPSEPLLPVNLPGLGDDGRDGSSSVRPSLTLDPAFTGELDEVRERIFSTDHFDTKALGTAVAVSSGISVGYVAWLARGGLLLASLMSSMPAWRLIDPMPILARLGEEEEDDGESLASLVEGGGVMAATPAAKQSLDLGALGALQSAPGVADNPAAPD